MKFYQNIITLKINTLMFEVIKQLNITFVHILKITKFLHFLGALTLFYISAWRSDESDRIMRKLLLTCYLLLYSTFLSLTADNDQCFN